MCKRPHYVTAGGTARCDAILFINALMDVQLPAIRRRKYSSCSLSESSPRDGDNSVDTGEEEFRIHGEDEVNLHHQQVGKE